MRFRRIKVCISLIFKSKWKRRILLFSLFILFCLYYFLQNNPATESKTFADKRKISDVSITAHDGKIRLPDKFTKSQLYSTRPPLLPKLWNWIKALIGGRSYNHRDFVRSELIKMVGLQILIYFYSLSAKNFRKIFVNHSSHLFQKGTFHFLGGKQ